MTWERVDPDTLDLENHRRELVMVEEVLRQVAEYWDEVRRQFELNDNLPLNVPFNSWGYWREFVQSSLSRLGYPPLTLPLFRVQLAKDWMLDDE